MSNSAINQDKDTKEKQITKENMEESNQEIQRIQKLQVVHVRSYDITGATSNGYITRNLNPP